ncbi:hypothetical protein H4P12_07380 [Paracoccus sp. 11-3]|uniref:Uncharacterized protein n=1 Tax=Paracoccus amoyensis TaxID=2760093 RepID=A0A926JAY3_9RHOB|nr:hypothetical protein [Paracoccus amoyensis]MBC9246536.1 hypothetical protein [Paracoccus amoyensis]
MIRYAFKDEAMHRFIMLIAMTSLLAAPALAQDVQTTKQPASPAQEAGVKVRVANPETQPAVTPPVRQSGCFHEKRENA